MLTVVLLGLLAQRPLFPSEVERAEMPAPPPAAVYRLADRTGQVWHHADPAWLREWVGRVNATRPAAPVPAAPAVPVYRYYSAPCVGSS